MAYGYNAILVAYCHEVWFTLQGKFLISKQKIESLYNHYITTVY